MIISSRDVADSNVGLGLDVMNEVLLNSQPQRAPANSNRPFTGGPKPNALIITCSDCNLDLPLSRLFQHERVFVLRTPGNEVPEHVRFDGEFTEALEEAVAWWKVPRIFVCGHSDCSEIGREFRETQSHSEPRPTGESTYQSMVRRRSVAQRLTERAKHRTLEQLPALRSYPFVANAIQETELQVGAMFYLHESGLLLIADEAREVFRLL